MRILVISDTHIPLAEERLPQVIEDEAKRSTWCLHAGDFINYDTFKSLSAFVKTRGVCGNMDHEDVKKALPARDIITIGGITIGLIHGRGASGGMMEYIKKEFAAEMDKINIIVYGHSHIPMDSEIGGKIFFNPGSPTDRVFAPYRSYGIIEIDGGQVKRRIVKIE